MAKLTEAYNTLAQNQQKEIEELKKENAELIEIRDMGCKVMEKAKETEKENAELTEFLKKTRTTMEKMDNIIKGQKKENEELKKEIEELKQENEKVKEYNNNEEWDELMEFTSTLSGSPAEPEDIKDYINGVNGMVGELKEEIEELKQAIHDKNACLLSWGEQEKKLKAILYEGDNEK